MHGYGHCGSTNSATSGGINVVPSSSSSKFETNAHVDDPFVDEETPLRIHVIATRNCLEDLCPLIQQ